MCLQLFFVSICFLHPSIPSLLSVLCLSRHDVCDDGALQFDSHVATLSQDVWAFKAPLPKVDAKFLMGKPGCDNRIAYEFRRAGLRVNNPAYSIMAAHLHMSQKRNYTHGKDTVPGPYALVVPVVAL